MTKSSTAYCRKFSNSSTYFNEKQRRTSDAERAAVLRFRLAQDDASRGKLSGGDRDLCGRDSRWPDQFGIVHLGLSLDVRGGRTLPNHRSAGAANTQSAVPRCIEPVRTFAAILREEVTEVLVPRGASCRWMSTFTIDSPELSDTLALPAPDWFVCASTPPDGPYRPPSRPASWGTTHGFRLWRVHGRV